MIARAEKADYKTVARQREMQEKMFAILKKEKDDKAARERLDALLREETAKLSDDEKKEAEKVLKDGWNKDVTVKENPKLNHLFQTCETGAPSEYAKIDETFAPAALEEISGWIGKRFGAR